LVRRANCAEVWLHVGVHQPSRRPGLEREHVAVVAGELAEHPIQGVALDALGARLLLILQVAQRRL
jgi:hypothetical protein